MPLSLTMLRAALVRSAPTRSYRTWPAVTPPLETVSASAVTTSTMASVTVIYDKKLCCRREAARASCLSVVSFNSTIPRARSFVISYLRPVYSDTTQLN